MAFNYRYYCANAAISGRYPTVPAFSLFSVFSLAAMGDLDHIFRFKHLTFSISQICTSEIEYTLNISSCMKAATQGIPGSLLKYVTGVSEESQRTCSLKYDGYKRFILLFAPCWRILDNG
ncbi:hypothetical protein NCF86_15735 (plasmid) [Pelagerythrobacter marinus]|nr:hypothetical protein NCF86_15735 [Pelagerythrobacter marinus]